MFKNIKIRYLDLELYFVFWKKMFLGCWKFYWAGFCICSKWTKILEADTFHTWKGRQSNRYLPQYFTNKSWRTPYNCLFRLSTVTFIACAAWCPVLANVHPCPTYRPVYSILREFYITSNFAQKSGWWFIRFFFLLISYNLNLMFVIK